MYSKIKIRFEAAKIAASLPGITKDNFKDMAQIISDFIIGGVEIPD